MFNKIFSMKMAVVLMMLFATSIGVATFIENDYGTQTARALIYDAKWFEFLLFYFIVTIIYNIVKFKMYKRQKWGQLILHLAFLFIAIGAATTRYIGYEGVLHLREGQVSNKMVSDYMVLNLNIKDGNRSYIFDRKLELSSMTKNSIKDKVKVDGKTIDLELIKYLPSAKKELVKVNKGGSSYLELKVAPMGQRGAVIYLKDGQIYDMGSFVIGYNKKDSLKNTLLIRKNKDGNFTMSYNGKIATKSMNTLKDDTLEAGEHPFKHRMLYNINGSNVVFKSAKDSAKVKYVSNSLKSGGQYPQMVEFKLKSGKDEKIVKLFGHKATVGEPKSIKLNGMDITLSYGAKIINLPFEVKLDKFQLDRYPGSMQPSSYSSYVRVINKKTGDNFKYHIYMNHVLDYKGYRFFQSSFDMDERGSILSVNHDPGTLPTYVGYLMLAIGFLWSFLSEKGRVKALLKKLKKLEQKSVVASMFIVALFFNMPLHSANIDTSNLTPNEIKKIKSIPKIDAEKFAHLIVQNNSGRMEPMDSLDLQVVKKISSKTGFLGLDYNQIFLGMILQPDIYHKVKMIKIDHPLLNKKLGLAKSAKYASFNDFFDNGNYKLTNDINKARATRPAVQSKYQKEIIKVDEKLNVMYMTDQGILLKFFPKPNDPNNTWYNPLDAIKIFPQKEGQVVKFIVSSYLKSAVDAIDSGDWKKANDALDIISNFQKFYGSKVMPPKEKVETEIRYNHIDIFTKLILPYIIIGLVLLLMAFISIVKPQINIKFITKIAAFLLIITLILHTVGLIVRWYIADHAPWSNAYESILYIAWATAAAGFVFAKRSPLAFAATSILAGIFLGVAFLSNLNPQITNLVPVLKSYWLMIHVAVITASYGFLGLGALLGMFVLILMIVNKDNKDAKISRAIKELTIINEITLLIGLALVTVGNFLGGVWANESWGRYWGWDPKETWAAVTILVYAAVVHMRFIPKLNSIYAFNVAAVLAYFSVIMTYFGVNYYLSGMHSYAAGDPVPIPTWTYFAVASVFALIAISYKYRVNSKL